MLLIQQWHKYPLDQIPCYKKKKFNWGSKLLCQYLKTINYNSPMSLIFYRSSAPEVFCEKGVLRNFTKCTGKHPYQSLFFNKFAGLGPATILNRRLWHRCFPVNFAKLLWTPLVTEHLWWLLLSSTTWNVSNNVFLIITF